jgi:hypothetical protein
VAEFKAEVFQNEFLAEGATDVHAVVSVTCTAAGKAGQSGQGEAAEIIIVDTSGSMDMPASKIVAARRAAKVALGEIVDGTWFAVISGHSVAQMVYPTHPGMAKMTDVTRREATHMVDALRPGGATAIGAWRAGACDDQGIQPRDLPVRCRNVPHQIVKPCGDAPETQPGLTCDEAL